jgi:putative transposase
VVSLYGIKASKTWSDGPRLTDIFYFYVVGQTEDGPDLEDLSVPLLKSLQMKFIAENLYHIYNQGNNCQQIFSCHEDYLTFLREIRICISPHTELIAYCLMPNHFHLMAYADERVNKEIRQGGLIIDPLTNGIRKQLSGYTKIFNKHYGFSGSLFRQKTKSKCLSDIAIHTGPKLSVKDYCVNCFHYIHQNPIKAGLVTKLEDSEYSSFKDYAGLRNGTLCNRDLAIKHCYYNQETFLADSYKLIDDTFDFWID